MRTKNLLLILSLTLLITLFGCQAAPEVTEAAPVVTEAAPLVTEVNESAPQSEAAPAATEAPVEVQSEPNVYPAPVEYISVPYPAPLEGESMEWDQVLEMISSGNVVEVYQALSLEVAVTLNDGRVLVSVAPERDQIFQAVMACGTPCAGIKMSAEYK